MSTLKFSSSPAGCPSLGPNSRGAVRSTVHVEQSTIFWRLVHPCWLEWTGLAEHLRVFVKPVCKSWWRAGSCLGRGRRHHDRRPAAERRQTISRSRWVPGPKGSTRAGSVAPGGTVVEEGPSSGRHTQDRLKEKTCAYGRLQSRAGRRDGHLSRSPRWMVVLPNQKGCPAVESMRLQHGHITLPSRTYAPPPPGQRQRARCPSGALQITCASARRRERWATENECMHVFPVRGRRR